MFFSCRSPVYILQKLPLFSEAVILVKIPATFCRERRIFFFGCRNMSCLSSNLCFGTLPLIEVHWILCLSCINAYFLRQSHWYTMLLLCCGYFYVFWQKNLTRGQPWVEGHEPKTTQDRGGQEGWGVLKFRKKIPRGLWTAPHWIDLLYLWDRLLQHLRQLHKIHIFCCNNRYCFRIPDPLGE